MAFGRDGQLLQLHIRGESDSQSVGRKSAITAADVKSVLAVKQNGMLEDVVWMEHHMERIPKSPGHKIVSGKHFQLKQNGSSAGVLRRRNHVPTVSEQYHYPRNTRPQMQDLMICTSQILARVPDTPPHTPTAK